MKPLLTDTKIFEYHFDEFTSIEKKLIQKAEDAVNKAYAKYSGFMVGAAVLLDNQKIVTGNNQENIAYPSGLCAERVAAFYAKANFPDQKIVAIAIAAKSNLAEITNVVTPCGSCRQSLIEYEISDNQDIKVIMTLNQQKFFVAESLKSLLPFFFNSPAVKKA